MLEVDTLRIRENGITQSGLKGAFLAAVGLRSWAGITQSGLKAAAVQVPGAGACWDEESHKVD